MLSSSSSVNILRFAPPLFPPPQPQHEAQELERYLLFRVAFVFLLCLAAMLKEWLFGEDKTATNKPL